MHRESRKKGSRVGSEQSTSEPKTLPRKMNKDKHRINPPSSTSNFIQRDDEVAEKDRDGLVCVVLAINMPGGSRAVGPAWSNTPVADKKAPSPSGSTSL
mmetsp:Transcript_2106/g.4419  ORF Transcript_2106/g.4419 Transcript_2106/m.4419 type:complete len:99 (-) Transcript_2106:141-437(-)